uniref:Uncharacterized protein n=1 Tax=Lepeophtheirus salmonis TaxID=72036 RepID=A0A0K2TC26_LEPSM
MIFRPTYIIILFKITQVVTLIASRNLSSVKRKKKERNSKSFIPTMELLFNHQKHR